MRPPDVSHRPEAKGTHTAADTAERHISLLAVQSKRGGALGGWAARGSGAASAKASAPLATTWA